MSITIEAKFLKALFKSAGTKDVRYYLNCVRVVRDELGTFLLACNGHIITIARIGEGGEAHESAFWSKDAVYLPGKGELELTIGRQGEFSLFTQGVFAISTDASDKIGKYPNWRKMLRTHVENGFTDQDAPQAYDIGYMKIAGDIFKAYNGPRRTNACKYPKFLYTGATGSIIVHDGSVNPSLITLFIPMYCEKQNTGDINFEFFLGASDENDK